MQRKEDVIMSTKNKLLKSVIKHFLIMIGLCIMVSIGLYLLSLSPTVKVHPNAYRDMIRNVVVIYVLFFCVLKSTEYLLNRYIVGNSDENEKFSLREYFERITPYETIAITFTLLTIVNSIMMLTGVDTPKEGVSAYIHLITRLGIITLVVITIFYKEIKERLKCFDHKELNLFDVMFGHKKDAFISVSKTFTNTIVLYCIMMITFQWSFDFLGGRNFYVSLLVVLGIITLIRVTSSLIGPFFRKQIK